MAKMPLNCRLELQPAVTMKANLFYLYKAALHANWRLIFTFTFGVFLMEPEVIVHFGFDQILHTGVWSMPWTLLEKVGEAMIIAAVLAFIVDKALKRELLSEVTRDALSVAAGHTLPDPIKEAIADIIQQPYARKNFVIEFTLTELPENPHHVKLHMHTSYEVISLTHGRQEYVVRSSIERPQNIIVEDSKLLNFDLSGPTVVSLIERDLSAARKEDSFYYIYEQRLLLSPKGKMPLEVSTCRSIICEDNGNYVLDVLEFTIGVDIVLLSNDRFEWDVHFGFHKEFGRHENCWSCSGVFLPGQFIRVSWKRKN